MKQGKSIIQLGRAVWHQLRDESTSEIPLEEFLEGIKPYLPELYEDFVDWVKILETDAVITGWNRCTETQKDKLFFEYIVWFIQ